MNGQKQADRDARTQPGMTPPLPSALENGVSCAIQQNPRSGPSVRRVKPSKNESLRRTRR